MYVRNLFMSNNRQHTQLYLRPEVRQRNQQIFYSVSAGHCQCALFHLIVGLAHHHHDHQQAIIYCIYMWCRSCCRTTFCPTANDEKNIKKKIKQEPQTHDKVYWWCSSIQRQWHNGVDIFKTADCVRCFVHIWVNYEKFCVLRLNGGTHYIHIEHMVCCTWDIYA